MDNVVIVRGEEGRGIDVYNRYGTVASDPLSFHVGRGQVEQRERREASPAFSLSLLRMVNDGSRNERSLNGMEGASKVLYVSDPVTPNSILRPSIDVSTCVNKKGNCTASSSGKTCLYAAVSVFLLKNDATVESRFGELYSKYSYTFQPWKRWPTLPSASGFARWM